MWSEGWPPKYILIGSPDPPWTITNIFYPFFTHHEASTRRMWIQGVRIWWKTWVIVGLCLGGIEDELRMYWAWWLGVYEDELNMNIVKTSLAETISFDLIFSYCVREVFVRNASWEWGGWEGCKDSVGSFQNVNVSDLMWYYVGTIGEIISIM